MYNKKGKTARRKYGFLPLIACIIAIIGIMTVAYGDMNANDTSAGWNPDTIASKVKIGEKTYSKKRKLKVLEILPIEQQSELGYMMGSEAQPVPLEDIYHLLYPDNTTKKPENYDNFTACLQTWDELMHTILGEGYDIEYYMKNADGSYDWKNENFQGYGGFQLDRDKDVFDKLTYRFVKIVKKDGDIVRDIVGYKDENGDKMYAYNLLAYSLYNNSDMCDKMVLVKKTPNDVTMDDIENADLIYMSARGSFATTGKYHDLYNKMSKAVKEAYTSESATDKAWREKYPDLTTAKTYVSAGEDLKAEVAWKLYRAVAGKETAFMYDDMDYESKTVNNGNIFKIFTLINCADRDLFRQQFWKDVVTENEHYSGEKGYVKVEHNTINIYYEYHNPWNSTIVDKDHMLGGSGGKTVGVWSQYMFTNAGSEDAFYYSVMGEMWTNDSEYYYGIDGWPSRRVNVWDNVFTSSGWNTIMYNGISGTIDLDKNIKGSSIADALAAFGNAGENINISAIIKYILGEYGFKTVFNDELRVLEIEPAGGYKYADISDEDTSLTDAQKQTNLEKVEGILNYFNVKALNLTKSTYHQYVDIKSVAMNEFIAMNEDIINNYDLVIIGDCNLYNGKDLLNLSKTLLYTPRGPIHTFSKITKTPLNQTVLSGNDLTGKALKKLQAYVAADKLLVVADTIANGDTTKISAISNVYKLKEMYDSDKGKANRNILKESDNEDDDLRKPAYYARPDFSVTPYNSSLTFRSGNMIMMNKSDLAGFKFAGSIKNLSSKPDYRISVYVDKDGNGFYNETTEKVLKDQELVVNKSTATFVTPDLKLGNDLKGYLSYKVVLTNAGNGMSSEFNGSFVVKFPAEDARVVRILQIYSECKTGSTEWGPVTLYLRNLDGSKSTFQRTVENYADIIAENTGVSFDFGKDPNGNYYIDEMSCKEFREKYVALESAKGASLSFPEDDWLVRDYRPAEGVDKGYDIIVMGFADAYGYDDIDADKEGGQAALDNLYYYVKSGKPILMGHDVIGFNAYSVTTADSDSPSGVKTETYQDLVRPTMSANELKWSYNITERLRDIIGMDRYGVSADRGGLTAETYNQGYSNGFLLDKILQGAQTSNGELYNSALGKDIFNSEDDRTTKQISKINSGQITQYPLYVDNKEKLDISKTHPQYFQVDLDEIGDGQNDVIVWYSLSKDGDNYYTYSGKDGLNNYYIYSKGNVTYSGAGHRDIGYDSDEMKLFINTFIKALGKFNSFPSVSFPKDVEVKPYSVYEKTVRFDPALEADKTENLLRTLKIEFKVQDDDVNDGEQLSDAYMFLDINVDAEGNLAPNGLYDEGTDVLLKAYTDTNHLLNGMVYVVPVSGLSDDTVTEMRKLLDNNQLAVTVMASDNMGGKGVAKLNILNKDLFQLE